MGKTGSIVGVGIDCTGEFCGGQPSSVAVKRSSDNKLLCEPVVLEMGVVTPRDDYWRAVKINFDLEHNTCTAVIGGVIVLDRVHMPGIAIPKKVCVAVCAAGCTNRICVNGLKLKSEAPAIVD